MTKTELPRWLHFVEWHLIFVCPQYIFHWHLIHLGGYQNFWKIYKILVYVILHFTHKFTLQNKWNKNFEHYCLHNGIMNLLLSQHENTSVADKTNNPKQFSEQQNLKHNYYCTVVSSSVTKLSTWRLKCYTAATCYEPNIISFLWCQKCKVREMVNAHMPSLVQRGWGI
jgi:hypothetical protein